MNKTIHPWLAGLAAIVPGLGFLVLRQYRNAIIVCVAILGLLMIWIFAQIDWVRDFSLALTALVWANQIIYSFRYAKFLQSQANKRSSAPKQIENTLSAPPSNLTRDEKTEFNATQIIESQSDLGERCEVALKVIFARYSTHYLGLTAKALIIVATDFMGKPIDMRSIAREELDDIWIDEAMIGFRELHVVLRSKETLEYRVSGQYNALNKLADSVVSKSIQDDYQKD